MLKKTMFGFGAAAMLTLGVVAFGAEDQVAALPNCPITGEPIDFSVSTDTAEGPVYFCCKGCIKKYKANPQKYAKLVADQRTILSKREKIQVKCPVSGEEIDEQVTADYNGKKVAFCCKSCKKKFVADPAKYQARLASAYTYQTKCPITGETITPSSFTVLPTGETIYYCCNGCDKKFRSNIEKYAPGLAAQGIHLDVAKLKKAMAEGKAHHGHGH